TDIIDKIKMSQEDKECFLISNTKISINELLGNIQGEEKSKEIIEMLQKEDNLKVFLDNISVKEYLEINKCELELDLNNEQVFGIISDYLEEGYIRFEKIINQSVREEGDFIENLEEKIARDNYVKEIYNGLNIYRELSLDDNGKTFLNKINSAIDIIKNNFIKQVKDRQKLIIEYKNNYFKLNSIKIDDKKYFNYNPKLANKLVNELSLRDIKREDKLINLFENIKEIMFNISIFKNVLEDKFDNSWAKDIEIPRYIATWKGNKDVLVVLYTGSMSNYVREGLMEFFDQVNYKKKILLSTSAVEVGVDFNCDLLITEETNVASFLQRFGRAGRSGKDSRVILFVSNKSYRNLKLLEKQEVSREKFSEIIGDVFEEVKVIEDIEFLRAYHYIINKNIGRIGTELNNNFEKNIKELGDKLRAEVNLNYGLRGTMPSVSLRGGVTKNPFYILRFLGNGDLLDSDSPFEIAYTDKSFDSLIWMSYKEGEDVYVDINSTFKYSKMMVIEAEKKLNLYVREGICDRYEKQFLRKHKIFKEKGEQLYTSNKYNSLEDYDKGMLRYLLTDNYKFILGFGDIFLHKDSGAVMIEDRRLSIPNQFFLFLAGNETQQVNYMNWMQDNRIFDYGEVIVDDTNYENELNEEHQARNPYGVILLENINGALLYLYKRIIDAQKTGELI
ncbi:MAG: helicase C-terminal domain-containing protein, partial [bacterium]